MVSLKKLLILLSSSIVLSGCSLFFVSRFDYNEQARLITVLQLTQHAEVCADPAQAAYAAQQLNTHVEWLQMYSRDLPHNEPMQKMNEQLMGAVKEFVARYKSTTPVSKIYCESKMHNIQKIADVMRDVSARRPR